MNLYSRYFYININFRLGILLKTPSEIYENNKVINVPIL